MEYMSCPEAAEKWGISERRVQLLCKQYRIPGEMCIRDSPYLFDGSMSMEDYALMHRMLENERSERMAETILSGYLSNLRKYTEGRPAGEWVSFPTTAEHLKEVFDPKDYLHLYFY